MESLHIYIYYYPLVFLVGISIGSFLNVFILRSIKEENTRGRSYCPRCGRTLSWSELLPILSYILLLGRCKHCRKPISIQYPLVELWTGIMFVVIFSKVVGTVGDIVTVTPLLVGVFLLHLFIWSLFIIIAVYDLKTKLMPTFILHALAFLTFVLFILENALVTLPSYWDFVAGPILFIPFYFLWTISNGKWLGSGDGKLALGIGWYLGLSMGGTAIMFAFWIGAVVSIFLIAVQWLVEYTTARATGEKLTLKSEVPFGPFMILGTLLVYLLEIDIFSNILYWF